MNPSQPVPIPSYQRQQRPQRQSPHRQHSRVNTHDRDHLQPHQQPSRSPSASPLSSSPVTHAHHHSQTASHTHSDLFIRNLSPHTVESTLFDLFSQFGIVDNVRIIYSRSHPVRSREIAYVSFMHPADAMTAMNATNGTIIDGRAIIVSFAAHFADKKDFLFSFLDAPHRALMQIDSVGEYSVSDTQSADEMSVIIQAFLPLSPTTSVTDATACCGGNTLSFARHFAKVNACEIDDTRFAMLRNNVTIAGVSDRVALYHGDYLSMINTLQQDAVFIDPPWLQNDIDYRDQSVDNVRLSLTNKSMAEICLMVQSLNVNGTSKCETQLVLLKLPNNFDFGHFIDQLLLTSGSTTSRAVNVAKLTFPKLAALLVEFSMQPFDFIHSIQHIPLGSMKDGINRYVYVQHIHPSHVSGVVHHGCIDGWLNVGRLEGGEDERKDIDANVLAKLNALSMDTSIGISHEATSNSNPSHSSSHSNSTGTTSNQLLLSPFPAVAQSHSLSHLPAQSVIAAISGDRSLTRINVNDLFALALGGRDQPSG